MRWRKLGKLFGAQGQRPWMQSHTAVPVPWRLEGDVYRIFFGTRDAASRPHVGFVDVDLSHPSRVLFLSERFVLGPGPPGYFDDNGVYPGCIVEHDGQPRMYFLGRSNGQPPLYYMAVGLATSCDGGLTFQRVRKAPVLARSEHDPWMVSTPFVLREERRWRMWYLSGLGWQHDPPTAKSYYHIKYAESTDGITWHREGRVCIDLLPEESNIASPCVLRDDDGYRMWYSFVAGNNYRIGYAESDDGLTWRRRDQEVGLNLSDTGWDSESMAYPYVFVHDGRKFMVYSGNANGKTGMGLAYEE